MAKEREEIKYYTIDELFHSPRESSACRNALDAFLKEKKEHLLDDVRQREMEDWSLLADKVVGAENQ